MVVRQATRATFRRLVADAPTVMLVESGVKGVRDARGECRVEAGTMGLLPPRTPLEIENVPAPGGPYVARALLLPESALEGLEGKEDRAPPACGVRDGRARAAFERAAGAANDPSVPPALRAHLAREVLLWLAEAGLRFPPAAPAGFADAVRARLAAAPARPWRADALAEALATSAPTLRRRLAAEGTSFAALLAEARMTRALALLQSSDLPVALVGEAVGYASPSRFAARFRARFGLSPARVRRGERPRDRIGTGSDRFGTPGRAPHGNDEPST